MKRRPAHSGVQKPVIARALQKEQIVTTIAMGVVLTFGFYFTDQYMAVQLAQGTGFWTPASAWDKLVPFAPGWIWVYLLYFPLCFLPLLFRGVLDDLELFRRTAAGFAIQFIVALAFFWLLPSRMIRPHFDPQGISEQVLFIFYQIDPGFNIFPSLHVANLTFVACLAGRLTGPLWTLFVWILCGLIAASTVLVKQHYLLDLPAGFLLGAASYSLAFSKRFAASINSKRRVAERRIAYGHSSDPGRRGL